jgi:16S rRNA (uracil1498-N3)-methyltransferase
MRLHRFIGNFSTLGGSASGGDFSQSRFKIYDEEILKQAKNVLRLKKGDSLILADGKLNEAVVRIAESDKKFLEVEILERNVNKNEPERHGILYCSILKRENFEWVVQKATEVGIKEIAPVISSRTVKLGLKEERLEKIIKEAAEQSGRGVLPILRQAVKFSEALENAKQNDLNLFFEIGGQLLDMAELREMKFKKIGIFIGPEGGWSPEEVEAIASLTKEDKNFKLRGLGKLTLRAETAAVAASWFVSQS